MNEYEKAECWKNCSPEQWDDWKWQIKNRIKSGEQLSKVIKLRVGEKEEIDECLKHFNMAITPYYASLIQADNPQCPIKKQAVPTIAELTVDPCDMADPLCEEKFSPVPGLVHRYPDRVLVVLTHKCSMYCRHCTRRRVVGCEDFSLGSAQLNAVISYIREHTVIRDVLLSGGDPLVMSDDWLENIIRKLRDIPHVEVIRIGTRTPVVLPMRITDGLLNMLKKYHPIWINTHFNHPLEITPESVKACQKIADAGIPLGNQSVLLEGVNNNVDTLKELFTKLVKMRVRPYYLYQCDVSKGIGHFRTNVAQGIDIMKHIRGYISGFAVPEYVIDAPGGGGKTPVNPEYIVKMDDSGVTLRNYEGKTYFYPNPPR
ncbi:MAG TPA: lysine 2,3-aminomutase [Clostridiales bacterium]|nr:lysine 2,3-aminomutase [Clostridiales bacterium]